MISLKNIKNDPQTRSVSVEQRSCRFTDENDLDVHRHYSYSACSVQCRKDRQLAICNCTSHLMPNTPSELHCDMIGLRCLNDNYEELSVVIAKWSSGRKGVVCDCLPSCTEIDVSVVHDSRFKWALSLNIMFKISIKIARRVYMLGAWNFSNILKKTTLRYDLKQFQKV